jgi:hypothetical protein
MSIVAQNGQAYEKQSSVSITDIDFIYKNAFKLRVWTYLRTKPKLTFKEYQNLSKDYICKQDAFDSVKQDITLWGIWDERLGHVVPKVKVNMDRIEGYRQHLPVQKEVAPSQPIVEPPPSIANQIAMMTATPDRTRRLLDKDLKAVAEEWFVKDPNITYETLQKHIAWPDFTKSNYYAMRADLRVMGRIPMPDEIIRGRTPSGDTLLARKNLETLKKEELPLFTYPQYMERFGHRSLEAHNFRSAMAWIMKKHSIPRSQKEKPIDVSTHQPTPTTTNLTQVDVTPRKPINAVTIMATVDLSSIPQAHHMAVADAFRNLFIQIRADGNVNGTIKVNILMDPPQIEVRRAVRFEQAT